MTREEVLKILTGYMGGKIDPESKELYHAIELLVDILESQFFLPSNIDEAALNAYPKMSRLSEPHGVIPADNKSHYLGDANEENRNAFKAGAEWMTKQGETYELEVESPVLGPPMICCPVHADNGDKVIVQIRKK